MAPGSLTSTPSYLVDSCDPDHSKPQPLFYHLHTESSQPNLQPPWLTIGLDAPQSSLQPIRRLKTRAQYLPRFHTLRCLSHLALLYLGALVRLQMSNGRWSILRLSSRLIRSLPAMYSSKTRRFRPLLPSLDTGMCRKLCAHPRTLSIPHSKGSC